MAHNPPSGRRQVGADRQRAATPTANDVAAVYSWLCRFTENPAECERLLVEVLRRARSTPPAGLASASQLTRLQFLTVQSVLRLRGVL